MASFRQQPAAQSGFWALTASIIVKLHTLSRGNTKEYRFYIPWFIAGETKSKMTLVCDYGFTTKKEADAFILQTIEVGRVKAIEACEYDVNCDVPQWTKHHAEPHPEAQDSEFPWGSPMSFEPS